MIADLGLVKAMAHASGFTVAAGTPGYMSPEQATIGDDLDRRADVYALGALTYRLLVGRVPSTPSSGDTPDPPSRLRPDVDAIVMRALEPQREARWPDAGAFAAALTEIIGTPPHATAHSVVTAHGTRPPPTGSPAQARPPDRGLRSPRAPARRRPQDPGITLAADLDLGNDDPADVRNTYAPDGWPGSDCEHVDDMYQPNDQFRSGVVWTSVASCGSDRYAEAVMIGRGSTFGVHVFVTADDTDKDKLPEG